MAGSTSKIGLESASAIAGATGRPDEVVQQLQRKLGEENGKREAATLTLNRLKRTVDFYRQGLLELRHSGMNEMGAIQRARDLVRALESEAHEASIMDRVDAAPLSNRGSGSPPRSYDVLRQSLDETQRRCESLNVDMVHQAEANEELVETLGVVKDANKRLLEQIRFQTDEISQLTQERVSDEERMEVMTRQHQREHEAARQDAQRRILSVKEAGQEQYNAVHRQLTDKLRYVLTRLEILNQDVRRQREEHRDLRKDMGNVVDAMQANLKSIEKDAASQSDALLKRHSHHKAGVSNSILGIEKKLASERDIRQNESLAWGHKHGSLAADKEDVQARMTRDISQLAPQAQALQRTDALERQAWQEERERLERQCEDQRQVRTARQETLTQLQRDVVRLESSLAAAQADCRGLEQTVTEHRRQIRDSDDALAAAVSGNEHLREQMEEQRRRFQEKNEYDLSDSRTQLEQKLVDNRLLHDSDSTLASRQLQSMEDTIREQDEQLRKLKSQTDAASQECDAYEKETENWRKQHDTLRVARQNHERELVESRESFSSDKLRLQASNDQHTSEATALEDEIRRTNEHLDEFRRVASSRATEGATRLEAAEAKLKDSQEELAELSRRHADVSDAHVRIGADTASAGAQKLEVLASLERNLESKKRIAHEEQRRLADALGAERRATEDMKATFERERQKTMETLKKAHEDTHLKLTMAENERSRVEGVCSRDLDDTRERVAVQQQAIDSLESDLQRMRNMLAESEGNLIWVRQEGDREEREGSWNEQGIREEIRNTTALLEKFSREDSDLTRQSRDLERRNNEDQQRLDKELEDVKQKQTQNLSDSEARLHRARAEFTDEAGSREARHRNNLTSDNHQEDALVRENTKLKSFLGEEGRVSAGISNLHTQLEDRIQKLQSHTDELRHDLHRTGDAGAGVPQGLAAGVASAYPTTPVAREIGASAAMSPHRERFTTPLPLSPRMSPMPSGMPSGATGLTGLTGLSGLLNVGSVASSAHGGHGTTSMTLSPSMGNLVGRSSGLGHGHSPERSSLSATLRH